MKKNLTALLLTLTVLCVAAASYAQEPAATAAPSLADEVNALKRELALLKSQCADDARTLVPIGAIVAYFGEIDPQIKELQPPDGWLLCDGKTKLDEPQYDELQKLVGDTVPDLRGYFLRGFDPEGNVDPEGKTRKLGVAQSDAYEKHLHTSKPHQHTFNALNTGIAGKGGAVYANPAKNWAFADDPRGEWSKVIMRSDSSPMSQAERYKGGRVTLPTKDYQTQNFTVIIETSGTVTETRPQNKAVNYIIRY